MQVLHPLLELLQQQQYIFIICSSIINMCMIRRVGGQVARIGVVLFTFVLEI